jgi:hypothetical protein
MVLDILEGLVREDVVFLEESMSSIETWTGIIVIEIAETGKGRGTDMTEIGKETTEIAELVVGTVEGVNTRTFEGDVEDEFHASFSTPASVSWVINVTFYMHPDPTFQEEEILKEAITPVEVQGTERRLHPLDLTMCKIIGIIVGKSTVLSPSARIGKQTRKVQNPMRTMKKEAQLVGQIKMSRLLNLV